MSNTKKPYNISETKLKRILEYNDKLKEQLDLPRIPVSEASKSLIEYCSSTRDPLIPSLWGHTIKEHDSFTPAVGGGDGPNACCHLM